MEYVKQIDEKIVLIDGKQLAQLMIDYDIGVAMAQTYTVKRVDLDYFVEEEGLVSEITPGLSCTG